MIGCLTRIRKRADTNFQKVLGVIPDLFGTGTRGCVARAARGSLRLEWMF
jgi:hypothetical protein